MLNLQLTKGSKRLLLIMPVIALAIVATGYLYYWSVNRSEDPRILPARKNFAQYDRLMRDNRFNRALAVLDEIEAVYRQTPGYENAFELGVIENNRASVYLVQAETERLSQDNPPTDLIEGYLQTARKHTLKAIEIYTAWQEIHTALNREQIQQRVTSAFASDHVIFSHSRLDSIVAKRVKDMETAVEEMPRRLSVTFTNLGVIDRYQGRPDDARHHYKEALALWPRNHVAQNNLNVLLGKPLENPSMLEKLFPPSRKSP